MYNMETNKETFAGSASTGSSANVALLLPPIVIVVKKSRSCANCNFTLPAGDENCSSLTAHCEGLDKNSPITYLQIINYLFKDGTLFYRSATFKPLGEVVRFDDANSFDARFICEECKLAMKNAYLSLKTIKDRHSQSSYIAQRFTFSPKKVDASTDPLVKIRRRPTSTEIPIKKRIQVAMSRGRERTVFQNSIRLIVHQEMKEFTKNTSLLASNLKKKYENDDITSPLPSDDVIKEEMLKFCPTVLKIFQGLFLKTGKAKKSENIIFTPRMRTAICLATYCYNLMANRFQVMFGLQLYAMGAPAKCYQAFCELGVSVSYITTMRVLKEKEREMQENSILDDSELCGEDDDVKMELGSDDDDDSQKKNSVSDEDEIKSIKSEGSDEILDEKDEDLLMNYPYNESKSNDSATVGIQSRSTECAVSRDKERSTAQVLVTLAGEVRPHPPGGIDKS